MFSEKIGFCRFFLCILFITTPSLFLSGTFFHSTKMPVAALFVYLFWLIYEHTELLVLPKFPKRWITFCSIAVLGLCMGLIDEIGIAALIILLGITLLKIFGNRKVNALLIVFSLGLSLIGVYYYRHIVGPYISYSIVRSHPVLWTIKEFDTVIYFFSFWWWQDVFSQVERFISTMLGGSGMIGITIVFSISFSVFVARYLRNRQLTFKRRIVAGLNSVFIQFVVVLIGISFMLYFMSIMLPIILEPVFAYYLYPIVYQTIIFTYIILIIGEFRTAFPKTEVVLIGIVVLVCIMNIVNLFHSKEIISQSYLGRFLGGLNMWNSDIKASHKQYVQTDYFMDYSEASAIMHERLGYK
jgi:hypothetical protein